MRLTLLPFFTAEIGSGDFCCVDHLSDAEHEIPAVRDNPCVNIAKYTSDGSDRKEEGGGTV